MIHPFDVARLVPARTSDATATESAKRRPERKSSGRPKASRVVPDTSIVVDGRLTLLVETGELAGCELLVPHAVIAELEAQANRGMDAGYNGLDEIVALQRLASEGALTVEFVGRRPSIDEIDRASEGAIDALIRQVAIDHQAQLITGDKVQAQVAAATGIDNRYLRHAEETAPDVDQLEITRFFSEGMMSVHLKQDVIPFGKIGTPGDRRLERIGHERLTKADLNRIAREVVEAARRDDQSFVEIERMGATVVQLRDMRIAIARPPFSDAIEITAVRPVTHLAIADYGLPDPVLQRLSDHSRGVFVSGPPGSGKSTFAQAIAEHLHDQGTVVKTMESPRDLVLPDDVTQYAPLERDIELTGDFLLLVRPDFVVYDEVRKTRDFEVFADMRLAGVGLVGVTHANRAIDAVQRLIGRVELGMIPQVVDTVVHIIGGKIQQILEMDFTVRVPAGMTEADLARPVIRVRDFQTKEELFEIYTYGEQVVVMPLEETEGAPKSGVDKLAEDQLSHVLRRHINGPFDVKMKSAGRAIVYVEPNEIASIIGRGGSNVQRLERKLELKLDIKTFEDRPGGGGHKASWERDAPRGGPSRNLGVEAAWSEEQREARGGGDLLLPFVRAPKRHMILSVGPEYGGHEVVVVVDGQAVMQGNLSTKGEMRVARKSPEGKQLLAAHKRGDEIGFELV